jgi:hypothetical protein
MSDPPALYRIVTRKAVFGIEVDSEGKIIRAAPYAKARSGQAVQPVLERLEQRWGAQIEIVDPPALVDELDEAL